MKFQLSDIKDSLVMFNYVLLNKKIKWQIGWYKKQLGYHNGILISIIQELNIFKFAYPDMRHFIQ